MIYLGEISDRKEQESERTEISCIYLNKRGLKGESQSWEFWGEIKGLVHPKLLKVVFPFTLSFMQQCRLFDFVSTAKCFQKQCHSSYNPSSQSAFIKSLKAPVQRCLFSC